MLTVGLSNGVVTGYQSARDIPASANGVAFTRYVKSDGGTDLVPESVRTFGHDNPTTLADFRLSAGATNAYPLVGPLIITEIMYRPPDVIVGNVTNDNALDEFIELTSVTNTALPLYDPAYPTNTWHLEFAVTFRFPTNVTVAAGASILVVSFDPKTNAALTGTFRSKYALATNVPIFGPYSGKLNNVGTTIELYKPDPVQLPPHPDAGYVPAIIVEKVHYQNTNGWPMAADGTGQSLQRLSRTGYANDLTNWFASPPTAGSVAVPGQAPMITTQPVNQLAAITSNVTFNVTANGTATLRYQWRFSTNTLSLQTNNTLLLTNVQVAQSGSYSVLVSNAFGTATSSVATLSVAGPPQPVSVVRQLDGAVQVTIDGLVGHIYELSATTNFTNWVFINRTTNAQVRQILTDATATNLPMRFYRGTVVQ